MQRLDLTGQKFGNWTALCPAAKESYWSCQCACGALVDVFIGSLRAGTSKGCLSCHGLWMKESGQASKNATKHGMHKSSEYSSWRRMKERCHRPKHEHYASYGGRGIQVCDRWRHSFENFLEDMGKKPTPKHTIDRIDVNGNYEPTNCRWVTMYTQNRNKRNNRWIQWKGMDIRLIDAAKFFGAVSYGCAKSRLDGGWEVEDALMLPAGSKNPRS